MNEIIRADGMPVKDVNNPRSPEVIAAEINYIKRQTQKVVLSSAIEVGRRLAEAKEMVKHGEWERWLQDNVNYSQSTANNLMALYREYGSDQQSLFDRINASAIETLSYTKAVALLVLPKEQREEFMEQNPVEDMSTRELQAAIKRVQEAEAQLDTAITERQKYQEKLGNEMAKVDRLAAENTSLKHRAKELEQRTSEAQKASDELEKVKSAKKKAEEKAKKLQEQIKALEEKKNQPDQQTLDRLTAEAEQQARAEQQKKLERLQAQLQEAQNEKEQIAKRLAAAGSEEMIQAKVILSQLQDDFNRMMGLSKTLANKGDMESASKLKNAIRNLCGKMIERTSE